MAEGDQRLRTVLDEYANFLREKKLAVPKHQPYLVRWVREFLLFARQHGGYTFEQTLDLFLADVGRRVGVKPWQIQQAADAVRIYRYPFQSKLNSPACIQSSRYPKLSIGRSDMVPFGQSACSGDAGIGGLMVCPVNVCVDGTIGQPDLFATGTKSHSWVA